MQQTCNIRPFICLRANEALHGPLLAMAWQACVNGALASKLDVHINIGFVMVNIHFQDIQEWVMVSGLVSGVAQWVVNYCRVVSGTQTERGILTLCVQGTFDFSACKNTVWSFYLLYYIPELLALFTPRLRGEMCFGGASSTNQSTSLRNG